MWSKRVSDISLQPADLLPGPLLDDPGIFEDQARSRDVEIIALGGLAHDLNFSSPGPTTST